MMTPLHRDPKHACLSIASDGQNLLPPDLVHGRRRTPFRGDALCPGS